MIRPGVSTKARAFCAVLSTTAVVTATTLPWGQAAAQTTETAYAIAPGSLDTVLAQFGQVSGAAVFYDAGLTEGARSPGATGMLTVDEALIQLLAGTGFSHRISQSGAVAIERTSTPNAASEGAFVMDELIVQGELRERTLQDSQTSAVVITGEELDRRDDFDIKDIFERTPNVSVANGELSFTIRGIEARGVGADGNGTVINVQVDGAALPTQESITFGPFSTWDLEQVEILRGPQSTQQGRNALAGAVIFRSKDPTYEYEVKGRAELGLRQTAGAALAINLPVVDDTLALRFSAEHKRTDGFVEAPVLGDDAYDPDELTTLRGKLLFEPTPDFSAVLSTSFSRNRTGEDGIVLSEFPDRRVNFANEPAEEGNDTALFGLRMSYAVSDTVSLESETTGVINDYVRIEDLTGPEALGDLELDQDSSSWSQELRVLYDTDRIAAVAGGFVTAIKTDLVTDATIGADFLNPALPASVQITALADGSEETFNFAFFGEAEIELLEISEGLSVIVGGRYDRENVDFTSASTTLLSAPLPIPLPQDEFVSADTTFDAFLPKLGIVYDWTDTLSTGFTVQRGYRAGGSFQNTLTTEVTEWQPEFTWNYEMSLRSQRFDRRLTANANLFYTQWRDQQVRVPGDSGLAIDVEAANAGESRLIGGELSLLATPTPELEIFGSVGVSDTEFTDFVSGGEDFSGNRFTFAPVVSAALGARYFFDNGVTIGADASYTGATFSEIDNSPGSRVDGRFLVNASISYEQENWGVSAYVRNLLDNDYLIQRDTATDFARAGEPLTFGVIAQVRF